MNVASIFAMSETELESLLDIKIAERDKLVDKEKHEDIDWAMIDSLDADIAAINRELDERGGYLEDGIPLNMYI